MFPNSDTSEIPSSNETHDCTAAAAAASGGFPSRFWPRSQWWSASRPPGSSRSPRRPGRSSRSTMRAPTTSRAEKDLNWLSIDPGAPGATSLTVKWGWDDTATSGANTRDAGSCSTPTATSSPTTRSTSRWRPTAPGRRSCICARPTAAPIAAPAPGSPTRSPRQPWPCLQTRTLRRFRLGRLRPGSRDGKHVSRHDRLLHAGHGRDRRHPARGLRQPGRRVPAQRLQLPLRGSNSDLRLCFAANNGFLTIVKVASPDDGVVHVQRLEQSEGEVTPPE